MRVSTEIIESAARLIDPAAFTPDAPLYDPFGHEEPGMRLGRQSAARATASLILDAAAPLIAKQTLEDAAIDLNNHAVAMRAPDAPETCQDADEGLCHHDATVTAYVAASQRLTARAATLTPKEN